MATAIGTETFRQALAGLFHGHRIERRDGPARTGGKEGGDGRQQQQVFHQVIWASLGFNQS
jgi:hypothetical protein